MSSSEAINNDNFNSASHSDALDMEGLEHIFRWASDMVAEGEDARVKMARERRVRRQVLEVVQKVREQKALKEASDETAYLQRRVIALLQKMQEVTEENSLLRQITISQFYALDRIPALEAEIKQLRGMDYEREAAVAERRYLMDALAKLKTDRDFLDELLTSAEEENARVARLLSEVRSELAELKERKWWHGITKFFKP
ncbi:MAG TPA: hypothetical protein V6C76_10700 [Drouetiella sp.]